MLRDGFVSMTKAGKTFFGGMASSDDDEDSSGPSVKGSIV
jgi:hypothetical protein